MLEGGNHGDEYEGQIAIGELIRELDPGRVQGRLILMPANNVHAVMAGQRVSPVDGLNFNRTFPGDTRGTITAADRGLRRRPHLSRAPTPSSTCIPAARRSTSCRARSSSRPTTLPCTRRASRRRAPSTRRFTVVISQPRRAAHRDRRRLPRRADHRRHRDGGRRHGVDRGARDLPPRRAQRARPSRRAAARATPRRGAATAPCSSCPARAPSCSRPWTASSSRCIANGTPVRAGERAGRIHCTWDPTRAPDELFYQADGILYGRRQPGRVRPGNCCLAVAAPYRGALA